MDRGEFRRDTREHCNTAWTAADSVWYGWQHNPDVFVRHGEGRLRNRRLTTGRTKHTAVLPMVVEMRSASHAAGGWHIRQCSRLRTTTVERCRYRGKKLFVPARAIVEPDYRTTPSRGLRGPWGEPNPCPIDGGSDLAEGGTTPRTPCRDMARSEESWKTRNGSTRLRPRPSPSTPRPTAPSSRH